MTSTKPISAPRYPHQILSASAAWMFAILAAGLLAAAFASSAARPQIGPEPLAVKQGRKVAVGVPIHALVQSGKALAPTTKFAPVALRGSRVTPNAPTAIGPEPLAHGRTVARGAPIHGVVPSGKALAPTTKFAPVVPRGRHGAAVAPGLQPRASKEATGRAVAGSLLM